MGAGLTSLDRGRAWAYDGPVHSQARREGRAMRFTTVVLQLNGTVTDRRERTCAEVRADEMGRSFAEGCRELLAEKAGDFTPLP